MKCLRILKSGVEVKVLDALKAGTRLSCETAWCIYEEIFAGTIQSSELKSFVN